MKLFILYLNIIPLLQCMLVYEDYVSANKLRSDPNNTLFEFESFTPVFKKPEYQFLVFRLVHKRLPGCGFYFLINFAHLNDPSIEKLQIDVSSAEFQNISKAIMVNMPNETSSEKDYNFTEYVINQSVGMILKQTNLFFSEFIIKTEQINYEQLYKTKHKNKQRTSSTNVNRDYKQLDIHNASNTKNLNKIATDLIHNNNKSDLFQKKNNEMYFEFNFDIELIGFLNSNTLRKLNHNNSNAFVASLNTVNLILKTEEETKISKNELSAYRIILNELEQSIAETMPFNKNDLNEKFIDLNIIDMDNNMNLLNEEEKEEEVKQTIFQNNTNESGNFKNNIKKKKRKKRNKNRNNKEITELQVEDPNKGDIKYLIMFLSTLVQKDVNDETVYNAHVLQQYINKVIATQKNIVFQFSVKNGNKFEPVIKLLDLSKIEENNNKMNKELSTKNFRLLCLTEKDIVYILHTTKALLDMTIVVFNNLMHIEKTPKEARFEILNNIILLNKGILPIIQSFIEKIKETQVNKLFSRVNNIPTINKKHECIFVVYDFVRGILTNNISTFFVENGDHIIKDENTNKFLQAYAQIEKVLVRTLMNTEHYVLNESKDNMTRCSKKAEDTYFKNLQMEFKFTEYQEVISFLSDVLYGGHEWKKIFNKINHVLFTLFFESLKFIQMVDGFRSK